MRTAASILIAISLTGISWSAARAGDDGIKARGLFIQSRPKQRTKKVRPRPIGVAKPPVGTVVHDVPPTSRVDGTSAEAPLGLGLSLFRVLSQAESIRVDPASTFRGQDKFRFVVEPGLDGYLYVFVRTGDGAPVMIYPDARLDDGDNFVYAHTVTEVPSRRNRQHDVFRLTGSPAVEHVTIVLTRQPLPSVPIAEDLVAYCASREGVCLWRPEPGTVAEVRSAASKPALVSAVKDAGKRLTDDAVRLLTREVVLGASDDAPTIVAVAGTVDAPLLAYELTIRHEK